ncbi:hypothetical protein [Bartonella tribocorum]|uniref:hypothetical protein n=1 Tax=Bartonella tribocorum TaxID=85701 RepID=UPI00056DF715|nr:hypothetical protein [Bartonella tribocorum]
MEKLFIILILATFVFPCGIFLYHGFKKWTYHSAFTTGIGGVTMMSVILLGQDKNKKKFCTFIEENAYNKSFCDILYSDTLFLFPTIAILGLIVSILFLCDELNQRDKSIDDLCYELDKKNQECERYKEYNNDL